MSEAFRPAEDAPAGWYPLPGGGQRYWDGASWAGEPRPPAWGKREPSRPNDVAAALALSLLFTPLVGIIWGAVRMPKNARDGSIMIAGGIVLGVVGLIVLTRLLNGAGALS